MANESTKKQSTTKRFNKKGDTAGNLLNTSEQIENSRKTLAPGGGQPIAKGKKWTNEHRVMQPRDEEGHFDYNSSAGYERKYDYHAERNGSHNGKGGGGKYKTLPTYARDSEDIKFALTNGLKKGQFLSLSDDNKKIIANMDISAEEFQTMLEESLGTHDKINNKDRANELKGEQKLSTVTLRGNQGKVVKTGDNIKDINTNMTKQGIAKALKDKLAKPLGEEDYAKYGPDGAFISSSQLASNQAHNALMNQKTQQTQVQKPQQIQQSSQSSQNQTAQQPQNDSNYQKAPTKSSIRAGLDDLFSGIKSSDLQGNSDEQITSDDLKKVFGI